MTKPKRRYVIDPRGKRIEVEEVTIPNIEKKARQPVSTGRRFAKLTKERQKLLNGASGAAWAIYSYLLTINWNDLHRPVKLTNAALAEIGVLRDAKYRALPWLERAGLIKVKRAGHHAPTVIPLK